MVLAIHSNSNGSRKTMRASFASEEVIERSKMIVIYAIAASLVRADLTIYVDAPLEVRRERVMRRGASEADRETLTSIADRPLTNVSSKSAWRPGKLRAEKLRS